MKNLTRRAFIESVGAAAVAGAVARRAASAERNGLPERLTLKDGWWLQCTVLVESGAEEVSRPGFTPKGWYRIAVPSTVLSALVKNNVYPDPRLGLNAYQMPDSSDDFNERYDLVKFSHLPDKRNPWREPYWYRTEFNLPAPAANQHTWLNFNCINYRAEVWLNGARIADKDHMAGMFQRFRFDITEHVKAGQNALAVKIYPVDHPGTPDKQVEVFGKPRGEHKEIERDVTEIETTGYDCMMTVPDRNMGICQEVSIDWTGPADLRHPFVVPDLPLPDKSRATLAISAELTNVTAGSVKGQLRGQIPGTDVHFAQTVELAPHETKVVAVEPKPVITNPRLWWPVNYGEQHLYDLALEFEAGGAVSATHKVSFGVRKLTTEMHEWNGCFGRRVIVNGEKIFCRGGYIQPELMFDWNAARMAKEIRYYADENTNLIYFEDIPNPPDEFLAECDRQGILFGNCFYSCAWLSPGPDYQPTHGGKASTHSTQNFPDDFDLLETCTIDLLKRYRNHPSLVMYMAMNEGDTREQVYRMWRKHVVELDGTRFWIPSAYFGDSRKDVPEWFKQDLPTGMNDWRPKSYGWQEPSTYFQWVRTDGQWMFKMESGSASLPPISSLAKFLDNVNAQTDGGKVFPLNATWAHHGANSYFIEYDAAIRRLHGEPGNVADYCWKGHLLTADQHRGFYEAVNHRLWGVTSGFTEWKINSSYPDVQWQNFDYFLKPGISHFYIKRACQPLHVQMDPIDHTVSVINTRLQPQPGLEVKARVFGLDAKLLWEKSSRVDVPANAYRETFSISNLARLAPFVFVKLELNDTAGRKVSDNFYWLRGEDVSDFKALATLPIVQLEANLRVEDRRGEKQVHVSLYNPSSHIAFFTQVALTRGNDGEEILPVLWDDNYFSLLPGEKRELVACVSARDLGRSQPKLEVGGWNIQTNYRCTELKPSKTSVGTNEEFTVAATVCETFLDASRVALRVDGQPVASRWAWARHGKTDCVSFPVSIGAPGVHRLQVADREIQITVA